MEADVLSELESMLPSEFISDFTSNLSEPNKTGPDKTQLTWSLRSNIEAGVLNAVSLLGVAFNILVFAIYYRKRILRSHSNMYVLSLSTSHILQCSTVVPLFFLSYKKLITSEMWCRISTSLTICVNLASVLSVLLITIDRNFAVHIPLRYHSKVSKKRPVFFIISVWVLSIIAAAPLFSGVIELKSDSCDIKPSIWSQVYQLLITLLGFVVPFVSISCMYFNMFRAAKMNFARNVCNSCEIKPSKYFGDNENGLRRNFSSERPESKNRSLIGAHKAAVTGFLVVVTFFICWSPYFTIRFYQQFRGVTIEIEFWINFATFLSSILNPYVYFYRKRSTKKLVKKLISRLFDRGNDSVAQRLAEKYKILTISAAYDLLFPVRGMAAGNRRLNFLDDLKSKDYNCAIGKHIPGHGDINAGDVKQLVHQNSTSSNESSDPCITTLSIDVDTTVGVDHQSLQKTANIEIPL